MTKSSQKLSLALVGFMMMSTPAFALTPVSEVYMPEGAPKSAPYWQDFMIDKGDRHWSYAARFLKEADLAEVIKGVTSDGVYFPPEAVVMGSIEAVNGAEKFITDPKGYPAFKAGVTYRLPVPKAQGFADSSTPTTQAELRTELDERAKFEALQEERYNNLQTATENAYAGLSAQVQENGLLLGAMRDQIDTLSGDVARIDETVAVVSDAAKEALDTSNAALEQSGSALEAIASAEKKIESFGSTLSETAKKTTAALQAAEAAQEVNERASMLTSNKGLVAIVAGLLALMIFISLLARRGLAKSKDVEAMQNRLDDEENGLAATRIVAEGASRLAGKTRDAHETLAEDVASILPTKTSDIMPDKGNSHSVTQLAELTPQDGKVDWSFTDTTDGQHYSVQFWRSRSTPVGRVESNVLRTRMTDETVEAMAVKKVLGNLARAVSSGRLLSNHADDNVQHAIAAE